MELLSWLRGLKNFQGILFSSQPDGNTEKSLKEFRYHRYHNLGIAPALAKEISLPELGKPPFVILNLPEPQIESWLEDFKLCNDRFFLKEKPVIKEPEHYFPFFQELAWA